MTVAKGAGPQVPADREERIASASARAANGSGLPTWYAKLLQDVDGKINRAVEKLLQPRTVTLWYTIDNGATTIPAGTYLEAPVDFPLIITGVTLLSRALGSLVLDVGRSTFIDYPLFTSIVASAPPTITAYKSLDDTLTGWTTFIAGGDILSISVTSNAGLLTKFSLGLRGQRMGQLRR